MKWLTKTHIGYLHIKNKRPCQDYSASYHDEERTIVTCCDGHGGDLYIRSDRGSRFASEALINTLRGINSRQLRDSDSLLRYIKINALSEWNRLVEEDYENHKFSRFELARLNEDDRYRLKDNPIKAYGSTMIGAMIYKNKAIIISLGDGGAFIFKRGVILPGVEDDEETVANITYSLCGDDAYNHIHARIYDLKDLDGILICTDGVINPYQSYDNFYSSFVTPVTKLIKNYNYSEVEGFINELGSSKGIGDDVSLGVIMKK